MKNCGKCTKIVYPTEELKCLDKVWHKGCFRCEVCALQLNMKTYKGFNKMPYCNTHYPTTKHTQVADTPEIRRIAENSKLQSQVEYHKKFETEKGTKLSVADDPETLRVKKNMETISNVSYHKDMDRKHQMESTRPAYEPQGPDPAAAAAAPRYSGPVHQPYKRQPGSISDYDPLEGQEQTPLGAPSPYTNRTQSNTVYATASSSGGGSIGSGAGAPTKQPPMGQPVMGPPAVSHQPPMGQPVMGPPAVSHQPPMGQPQQFGLPSSPSAQQTQAPRQAYEAPRSPQPPTQPQFVPYEPEPVAALPEPVAAAPPPPATAEPRYRALYDYDAADSDEVSFMEGDYFTEVEEIDEGWMTARVERSGQHGMVPANYVERV